MAAVAPLVAGTSAEDARDCDSAAVASDAPSGAAEKDDAAVVGVGVVGAGAGTGAEAGVGVDAGAGATVRIPATVQMLQTTVSPPSRLES